MNIGPDLADHIERFNNAWQKESETESNDLRHNGQNIWDEFKQIQILGSGAFGAVVLSKKSSQPDQAKYFALKVIKLRHVIDSGQAPNLINEKRILSSLNYQNPHPFIVQLQSKYCYKDNTFLYMGLEYVQGGEMFSYINTHGVMSESKARFYAGQVLLVFRYLHEIGIIYRDLKPENLMIDSRGYVKVTDFGYAKRLKRGELTCSLVGTPEYMAPEIIGVEYYNKSVDYWALGVLIYEMCQGHGPFFAEDTVEIYERIRESHVYLPNTFTKNLKTLLVGEANDDLKTGLLVADVTLRLGCMRRGAQEIMDHPWFTSLNFTELYNKTIPPPWVPGDEVQDEADFRHFQDFIENDLDIGFEAFECLPDEVPPPCEFNHL